jgi:magnesium protoporphyrin O-methyltransferase
MACAWSSETDASFALGGKALSLSDLMNGGQDSELSLYQPHSRPVDCRLLSGQNLRQDQSESLTKRGRHIPRITFTAASASITQSDFHSAPSVAASFSLAKRSVLRRAKSGDMLDPKLGRFDFVVAMDSLIHYVSTDICRIIAGLAERTDEALLVTFAPKTPALAVMHAVGRLFPRGDRAPAIEPVAEQKLRRLLEADEGLERWQLGRSHRVASGFYQSQALELILR